MDRTSSVALLHLQLAGTAMVWACAFVIGRAYGPEIAPHSFALLRFAIATAFLGIVTWRLGALAQVSPGRIPGLLALGLTGVFAYNALFFYGLQTVSAGRAALLISANPALTTIVATLLLGETLRRPQALGCALAFAGAAVVVADGELPALLAGEVGPGELALLGAVLSWSAYTLLGKRVLGRVDPLPTVMLSTAAGTVMLAFPAFWVEGLADKAAGFPPDIWAAAAFMGIAASGFGVVWYYHGIKTLGAARTVVYIYLVPLFAAALEYVLLGEALTASAAAGGACVIAGVWLAGRDPQKVRRSSSSP